MSEVSGPPESPEEQPRLPATMHALDHAARLADAAAETDELAGHEGAEAVRAAQLSSDALKHTAEIPSQVAAASGARSEDDMQRNPSSTEPSEAEVIESAIP